MPHSSPKCRLSIVAAAAIFRRACRGAARNPLHATQSVADIHTLASNDSSDEFLNVCQMFDELSDLDVVSVTSIIGSFSKQHRHKEAICLFSRMLFNNIRPTEFTFGTVIHSSTLLKDLIVGKQLHGCAIKMGLNSNVFVGSTSLDFYSKLSTMEEARRVFEDTHRPNVVSYTSLISGYLKKQMFEDALRLFKVMPERNVVSWNAMVCGFSQTGHNEESVNLFSQMLREGVMPDVSTFPCAIIAAANITACGTGKSFHACAFKCLGSQLDVYIDNALISFYAKCGSLEDSLLVFNKLHERNIVSWNALICGYAQNGRGKEAVEVFERMLLSGFRPNDVTLLGLLWACNHAGLVAEGYSYFNKANLEEPKLLKPEHYACMVDLLSRSGRFKEAEEFIHHLPYEPGIGFWKALLGGCQIHSNIELGEFAARKIMALDPEDVSSYIMLSNAHSAAGRWEIASTVRREIKEKQMKRIPGCSWIEIRNQVHVFMNKDSKYSQMDEIYRVLRLFIQHSQDSEASSFPVEFHI